MVLNRTYSENDQKKITKDQVHVLGRLITNDHFVTTFSSFLNDLVGQIFTLFVLTVAAAEAAIGLAILVSFFRNRGTIAVEDVNVMKG